MIKKVLLYFIFLISVVNSAQANPFEDKATFIQKSMLRMKSDKRFHTKDKALAIEQLIEVNKLRNIYYNSNLEKTDWDFLNKKYIESKHEKRKYKKELEERIRKGVKILNKQIDQNAEYARKGQLENINYIVDMRASKNAVPFITPQKLAELNLKLHEFYTTNKIPLYVFINVYFVDRSKDLLGNCIPLSIPNYLLKNSDDLNSTYAKALAERSKLTNASGEGALFDLESILSFQCTGTPRYIPPAESTGTSSSPQGDWGTKFDKVKYMVEHKHYLAFGKQLANSSVNVLVQDANANDLRQDDTFRNSSDPLRFGYASVENRGVVLERYITLIEKVLLTRYKKGQVITKEKSEYTTILSHLDPNDVIEINKIIQTNQYETPVKLTGPFQDYAGLADFFERFTLPGFSRWKSYNIINLKIITTSDGTTYNGKTARQLAAEESAGAYDMIMGLHFQMENGKVVIHWNVRYGSGLAYLSYFNLDDFWKDISSLNFQEQVIKYYHKTLEYAEYGFDATLTLLNAIAKELSDLARMAKIPEKYYNPDAADYNALVGLAFESIFTVVNPVGTAFSRYLISSTGYSSDKYTILRIEFAFYCGFWNGIIDQVQGIFDLVALITDPQQITSMVNSFKVMQAQGGIWSTIWGEIKKAHTEGNICEISEQIGVDVANLATIVIAFAKVGKVAQIAKIMEAIDPMTYIFRGAGATLAAFRIGTTYTYKLFKGIYQFTKVNGKWILQVAKRSGDVFSNIDWSLVKSVVMVGTDGKTYTVLMSVDPTEQITNAIKKVKEIIKDEQGRVLKDADGNMLAKAEVDGVNGDQLVVVKEGGDASGRLARTLDELAPGGKIPKKLEFNKWFDDLTQEELDKVWNEDNLRNQIEDEIRKPGGLHEWCMVCEVQQFKKWGVKMQDIKDFRTKTTELIGTNPITGEPFAHSIVNSEGRIVAGPGSKTFHNELQSLIGSSNNLSEFNIGLQRLIERWKIDPKLLPPFIK